MARSDLLLYLDASALVKLVVREPETDTLKAWLGRHALASSELARAELLRACRLADGSPARTAAARGILCQLDLIAVSRDLLERAATAGPPRLRMLDAIHLATALEVRADRFVAYAHRLLDAAGAAGLSVASPGA